MNNITKIERKVVSKLIKLLKENNLKSMKVVVDDKVVFDDGEVIQEKTEKTAEIIDAIFAVDMSVLCVYDADDKAAIRYMMICGNDGYDVIADCSYRSGAIGEIVEKIEQELDKYIDTLID